MSNGIRPKDTQEIKDVYKLIEDRMIQSVAERLPIPAEAIAMGIHGEINVTMSKEDFDNMKINEIMLGERTPLDSINLEALKMEIEKFQPKTIVSAEKNEYGTNREARRKAEQDKRRDAKRARKLKIKAKNMMKVKVFGVEHR